MVGEGGADAGKSERDCAARRGVGAKARAGQDRLADALSAHYGAAREALSYLDQEAARAGAVDAWIAHLVDADLVPADPYTVYEARRAAREAVRAWTVLVEAAGGYCAARAVSPEVAEADSIVSISSIVRPLVSNPISQNAKTPRRYQPAK